MQCGQRQHSFFAHNREKSYPYNSEIPISHQKVGQRLVQMKSTNKCNLGSLSTLFTLSFSSNDMDFIHYIRGDTDLKVPTFLTTFCFFVFLSSSRILLNDRKGTTVFTRLSLHAEIGISMHTAMQQRLQRNVNTSQTTHRETCC